MKAAPVTAALAAALLACGSGTEAPMHFTMTSDAFEDGGPIPVEHTCDGRNVSPPLAWSGAPDSTGAYALVVDDPDAPRGTFVHWVIYDLPGETSSLPGAVPGDERVEGLGGAVQGKNGFGDLGWGGPCPPPGSPHHYRFRLYALDAPLGLEAGADRDAVEDAMEGHVLGTASLSGTFGR